MDVDFILPYRDALPWSTRMGHALAALVGGALYTRAVVSQRRLPHQRRALLASGDSPRAETVALALDLVLLLPVLAVNTVLPFCFDSNGDELLSRLALAFAATWLGSFKAVGAALGRGPLAQAAWSPAQYVLLYAAPVYPSASCCGGGGNNNSNARPSSSQQQQQKQRLQGRLADDAGNALELLVALVANSAVLAACAYALVTYDIPAWPRSYVYALGLYGFVCVLMGVPAAMIKGSLGVTLVPPFDKPWLCHSVADYWGRRWNNTTSLHLRSLVYDIVVDGRWVRPGGHAMAAVGAGGGAAAAAAGTAAAANASTSTSSSFTALRRMASSGGLLGSYLSSANLAEMAGSRPASPASPAARRRRGGAGQQQQPPRDDDDDEFTPPPPPLLSAAPPSTPAGNTRSRARAAATATVTLASFDLDKKTSSPSPSPSPGRGGARSLALAAAAAANNAANAAAPQQQQQQQHTQLRRDVGVFTAFFVSAVFHEIILSLVVPRAALGWWFGFFVLQAPLMVAERTVLRRLRKAGVELPMLLRRALTTLLLLAVSRVFFFTPIEAKSDLAQRVAEAVTRNFSALGGALSSLGASASAAALRAF